MIAIQDGPRFLQVNFVRRRDGPGQLAQDLQIGANDPIFRRSGGNRVQPIQFALGFFHDRFGKLGGDELCRERVHFPPADSPFGFAQFLTDGLELLLQIIAALALVDVFLDLRLNLALKLQHVKLRCQPGGDHPQALFHVQFFKQPCLSIASA